MNNADNFSIEKKSTFFKLSLISALLGLFTPVPAIVFYIFLTWNTRDDGWLAVFVIVIALAWWSLIIVISAIFLLTGFIRKEAGRTKIFAVTAFIISALPPLGVVSFILIGSTLDSYGK